MKLSIVTINYNDAIGLRKTLESVANQATGDRLQAIGLELEHIIIDGASTDGSVDVIKDFVFRLEDAAKQLQVRGERREVKWISEKDKGIYDAMNKGIEIALGLREVDAFNRSKRSVDKNKGGSAEPEHYIQILNSGDCLYSPTVIEDFRLKIEELGRPGIVYGNMIRWQVSGERLEVRGYGRKAKGERRDKCMGEHEWTMLDFIKGTINHDPTWIRRDLYEKYGLYDPELKICSDWKWFVNAVIIGRGSSGESLGTVQPVYVPIDVTLFDVTGISETQLEKRETERWNEIRKFLPPGVVRDYELYTFPMHQVARLKKHHLWPLVYFMERVLFKLEKWNILK